MFSDYLTVPRTPIIQDGPAQIGMPLVSGDGVGRDVEPDKARTPKI